METDTIEEHQGDSGNWIDVNGKRMHAHVTVNGETVPCEGSIAIKKGDLCLFHLHELTANPARYRLEIRRKEESTLPFNVMDFTAPS